MGHNVQILEWYGPFSTPKDVVDWECNEVGHGKTYLYIFKGKKPKAKSITSFYCGQAFKQSAGKRLTNKNHHIEEVLSRESELEIWVAKFSLNLPNKDDVNLAERVLTAVLDQVIKTDTVDVLNKINKYRPKELSYLINEWYTKEGVARLHYRKGTIPSLINDILICYPDNENSVTYLWGNQRTKFIANLE